MNYKLWDRKTPINGVEADYFLNKNPFKNYSGDIILIFSENGSVSNVECKDILASVYNLDKTLDLDSFMTAYFEAINQEATIEEETI